MIAQTKEFALTGLANAILVSLASIAHCLNAQDAAIIMDSVQTVFATADRDGEVMHVRLQFV
jgi:hypothetical protein